MKRFLFYCFALLLLNILYAGAQTNVRIRKKDYKTAREGFKEAWAHVSEGNNYFRERSVWYGSAYEEYRKAMAYNANNAELNYKTGVAALYSDNKDAAAPFLLKALELKNDLTDDILLMTGRALQYSGNLGEAINMFNDYLNSTAKKTRGNVSDALKYVDECNSALKLLKDTLNVEIRNAGTNINSFADDYSPVFSADFNTLYFASRREIKRSGISLTDGKYDENIFYSTRVHDEWNVASPLTGSVNTVYCESPLYLDESGTELYIYTGYLNGGDIKLSKRKNGIWTKPASIPFGINSRGAETSFTFSPSGDEIWFVTDKGKNSIGGKDIYFIRKKPGNKWSKPENAGPNINTPHDEESVSFSETGDTLWFASKGHDSMGGFDIFYSVRDQEGKWSKAVNCGYPVNTPWNDLFYVPDKSTKNVFYLVSDRKGTLGGLDIFHGHKKVLQAAEEPEPVPVTAPDTVVQKIIVELQPVRPDTIIVKDTLVVIKEVPSMPAEAVKETFFYLSGTVRDSESGDPVLARIDIIDISTDMVIATTASSDIDGAYRIRLSGKKPYMVDFRGSGFLSDMRKLDIPEDFTGDVYKLNMDLVKVKVGRKVVLNNILFQTGKAILTGESYAELNRLFAILLENPHMRIEISGHTDNTGSLALNTKLSQDRARAVVEYLIQKGTDAERLEFRGYGPQQPVAGNTTAEGRARNRRVEFKILEF
ncbi:MAG: OmpA family protein [Bacteroidales bacterium]|nr:OmpA family protein [Bacteroidales bacterium]